MTRRVNQTTGQEEELVGGEWQPVAAPSPWSVGVATPGGEVAAQAPTASAPAPSSGGYQGPFGIDGGAIVRDRIANSAWGAQANGGPPLPATAPQGSVVGTDVGRLGANPPPPIDLGSGYLPEDQALIDAVDGLRTALGTGTAITAPQLPELPSEMFTPDPGLQTLADHATRRQGQVDELIAEMRSDQDGRRMRTENKWYLLSRWAGEWAATGDPAQAGTAMARVIAQNDDMRAELRQETNQLIQMGWSAEDAVIQAQAQLLSGQAAARRQQAAAGYERDTRQADLDFRASTANAQNATETARAQAQTSVTLAEIQRDAAERARQERSQIASVLATNPQYSNQAFGAMADNFTQDPGTRSAIADTLSENQRYTALMTVVSMYQSNPNRETLRLLQQWDPRLRENEARNTDPRLLLRRLATGPGAEAAFAANRDFLVRSSQFGTAPSP